MLHTLSNAYVWEEENNHDCEREILHNEEVENENIEAGNESNEGENAF